MAIVAAAAASAMIVVDARTARPSTLCDGRRIRPTLVNTPCVPRFGSTTTESPPVVVPWYSASLIFFFERTK